MRHLKKPDQLAEAASAYVGYTCRQGNSSIFGPAGQTWDGAFIDYIAQELNIDGLPKHWHSSAALAFYIKSGRIFKTPARGDIVFYVAAVGDGLEAPHVGIVTEASSWKQHSTFKAVEANVSSGQPRGSQENNGVYERVRFATEVLAFARPNFSYKKLGELELITGSGDFRTARVDRTTGKPRTTGSSGGGRSTLHIVRPSHLIRAQDRRAASTASPGVRKSVELIQLALGAHPAVMLNNADRGIFNLKTRAALAAFQRYIGYLNPTGEPDLRTLQELANACKLFDVSE